jgi:Plasmid pRiA4b ORF-3-like protein
MTDSPAAIASDAPTEAEPVPLILPAADLAEVTADIAAAPVVRWLRALTSWAGTGRAVADFARVPPADRAEVSALLGFDDAPKKERGLLVDIAVRWAVEANLLRLRTGTLRPAKQHLPLLDDPAALWFRMLSALARPDMAFTDLLGEYSGHHYRGYSLGRDVAELNQAVAEAGTPVSEAQLAQWHARRWGWGSADTEGVRHSVRVLALLATSLGILTREEDGRWAATGLGRVCATLTRLPSEELDDDHYDEVDLIAAPDSQTEPGFVMKVTLRRFGVWRRLRLPGELTAYGLHMVIQAAFGWNGDHLHTLRAGPFTFAPAWPVLEEAIPSEMVSLADLQTLGVRELSYRYDLGDCWDHEITVEKVLPPGEVTRPECLAGRGTTPAEDGGDWDEDDDGNRVPAAEPEPGHVYDLARINRALALVIDEPDETGDLTR